MKKRWKSGILLLSAMFFLSSCAVDHSKDVQNAEETNGLGESKPTEAISDTVQESEEETAEKSILQQDPKAILTFSMDYDPADYLELDGDYSAIPISAQDLEVSEEQIQNSVDALLLEHQILEKVTDRDALTGDTLEIDFTGTLDGEQIYDETNCQLELGSGLMGTEFEDGLEGARAGDQITLDLEYPKDYGNDLLNGKTVHFEITVHQVYLPVIPDYTDEFVAQYTNCKTISEYEASLREELQLIKKEDAVAVWLSEHSVLKEKSDDLRHVYEQKMLEHYRTLAEITYQVDFETFLKEMNYNSEEDFLADSDNQDAILGDMKTCLSYEYVAQKEGIQSTIGECIAYMESYAESLGYRDAKELLEHVTEEEIQQHYLKKLVADWMLERAVIQ